MQQVIKQKRNSSRIFQSFIDLHSLMKKLLSVLSLLLISLLLVSSSYAQAGSELDQFLKGEGELDIDQVLTIALANNPQIKRALLAIDDANQLVKIAYAEVLPDISTSASYTRNVEIPVFFFEQNGTVVPVQAGTDNAWLASVNVSQNLFKGEALVGISSANVFKMVQRESYRLIAQQIITQARVAYYEVLIAKESVRLQEAQINRLEENLAENKIRLDAGLIEEYDVLRLEVQLSNQRPQLIDAQYALDQAYRSLNVVIGIPATIEYTVTGDLNTYDFVQTDNMESGNAVLQEVDQMNPFEFSGSNTNNGDFAENRGDISVLDAQIKLKDREITAIKSRFLPTVSAFYNLQYNAQEPGAPNFFRNPQPPPGIPGGTNPIRSQALGISVSLPIFQGLQRLSDVTRARIQRKDLSEQRRETKLNALNEITTAKENLNKAFETADARKQALLQAQRGYEIAKARFDNGLGSQLEITDAETQVREAELNYASLIYSYLVAKAQYDLATGVVPLIDIKN